MPKRNREDKVKEGEIVPKEMSSRKNKFVGDKARAYFKAWEHKKCNVEVEFDFEWLKMGEFVDAFEWTLLAAKPKNDGSSLLVKEFYANMHELGHVGKSFVRGKAVDCSEEVINNFYKMPSLPSDGCDYAKAIVYMGKNWREKLDELAPTVGYIDPNKVKGGMICSTQSLEPEIRYLHRFICERIMPSDHNNEVFWKRAVLMHMIAQKKDIDFGRIMAEEMFRTMKKISHLNYNFPLLIMAVVQRSRVSMSGIIKDLSTGPKIDYKTLKDKSHAKKKAGPSSVSIVEGRDVDGHEENEEEGEGNASDDEELGDHEEEILELYRRDPASGMRALSLGITAVRVEVNKLNRKYEELSTRFEEAEQSRIAEAKAAQAHRALQNSIWEQLMARLPPQGIDWQQFVPPQSQPQAWQSQQSQGGDWDHHFHPPPQ